MFPCVCACNPLRVWYNMPMKRDQINVGPIVSLLGFFIVVCTVCIVTLLFQAISSLFAV